MSAVAALPATRGQELYERVLAAVADTAHGENEYGARLAALSQELAVAVPDGWASMAIFAADLATCVLGDAERSAALVESLAAIGDEGRRCRVLWELANAFVLAGRLAQAEAVAAFGLEQGRLGSSRHAAFVWHVRAEAARLLGAWDDALEFLAGMEACLPEVEPAEPRPRAAFHHGRSLLFQARAQVLLELGLLDQCGTLAEQAILEAHACDQMRAPALVAAQLLALDRDLMAADTASALERARAGLSDVALASWHPLFRLAEGVALVEEVRAAVSEGRDATALASRARGSFDAAAQGRLAPTEQLKLELGRCDLELCLVRPAQARAHLDAARALAADTGPPLQLRESVLVPALAWRLERASGAAPSDLAAAGAQLLQSYGRFLAQWQSTPRRPGGIGFLHLAWRAQLLGDVLEAELQREPGAEGVENAFARLMEAQALGTRARELGLVAPTTAELRRALLAPQRGLLVLFAARDSAHLFVLDSEALQHFALPCGRDALRAAAGRIAAALAAGGGGPDSVELEALHDRLLPEAARARLHGWREALTVGFDLGRDLPFGILAPRGCAPYGQRLALVSLPSLALGFDYAGRGDVPGGSAKEVVLVVGGDPPPGSPLETFRFARAERERWLAPFDPSTVEVLEGARATPAALRAVQALLGGARLVHFVAHGTLLPGRESSAALVLPAGRPDEERLLGAEQVERLRVGGLVVLSACSPGRGPARLGDDCLVNLGGAFLAAGARCVVLSRFPVEYHSTLALMEHFHRGLAQGASPAEALRAARARLASEDALAAAHAAAFEVIGLGFDPVFAR